MSLGSSFAPGGKERDVEQRTAGLGNRPVPCLQVVPLPCQSSSRSLQPSVASYQDQPPPRPVYPRKNYDPSQHQEAERGQEERPPYKSSPPGA